MVETMADVDGRELSIATNAVRAARHALDDGGDTTLPAVTALKLREARRFLEQAHEELMHEQRRRAKLPPQGEPA